MACALFLHLEHEVVPGGFQRFTGIAVDGLKKTQIAQNSFTASDAQLVIYLARIDQQLASDDFVLGAGVAANINIANIDQTAFRDVKLDVYDDPGQLGFDERLDPGAHVAAALVIIAQVIRRFMDLSHGGNVAGLEFYQGPQVGFWE